MEQNFKNYIRVKTIDSNYREHIDDYEIKFDKYKRINVFIGGDHCFAHRNFDYKGRSIKQLNELIKKHVIESNGDHWTIHNIGYDKFILEVIDIQIPDNPQENLIFDDFPDLWLGCCDEAIVFLLPELKKFVKENIVKEPNAVVNFPERINLEFPRWSFFNIEGEYGYNKTGKPRCKLKHFSYNPGGRFWFNERHNFTKIQNLIKAYIEND